MIYLDPNVVEDNSKPIVGLKITNATHLI
uniref:Uncharacterized protein n=1 Tax=Rhizophora mucronata TaxID=61149 RepID=A0A2P2KUX8_RHIMU